MSIKKLIKPVVASILLPLSLSAMATEDSAMSSDFFYVDVKAGAVIPTSIQGNSDLQSVTPNSTYLAGLTFGRKFMDRFGAELEYSYRGKSDVDNSNTATGSSSAFSNSWSAKANTFMFNLTTDLVTGSMIRPYVKLGAGFSVNKADQYTQTTGAGANVTTVTWNGDNSTHFAWNAGFGFAMNTSQAIETKIEYAFVDRGEFKTKTGSTTLSDGDTTTNSSVAAKTGKLRDHVVMLALGYKF